MTATGSFMATVPYAAPEVLAGMPIDGRADIYALGCALFRLLTGSTPFPANNPAAIMLAHVQQPPPRVSDLAPWLPPALDAVVAIAMAKDPAARFARASDLAAAAATALRNPTARISGPMPIERRTAPALLPLPPMTPAPPTNVSPRPAPARRSKLPLIGAAAVVVIGLVVAGVVIAWPDDGSAPANDASPSAAATKPPTAPTSQGRPATDVAPQALRPILLSGEQIAAAVGGSQLVLDMDSDKLLDDSAEVGAPQCAAAWAPAQQSAYTGSTYSGADYTGVAVQELRALNAGVWQDGVVQAVVSLPSVPKVSGFVQEQQRAWAICAGQGPVTVTPPNSPPSTWTFTAPVTTAGIVTLTATPNGAKGWHLLVG
jgi:serine/threonine-protein kinase